MTLSAAVAAEGPYVPVQLSGMRAAAAQYEGFILDLWGVVHDGAAAFTHSVETLRHLKEAGRKTIFLSNAPRRGHALIEHLSALGIPPDLYGGILSSGEATRQAMIERTDPFFAALGETCYHLGPDRDLSIYEDVPVRLVARLEEASFIVNTGPLTFDDQVVDYHDLLVACRARDLPMVCANPDRVVVRQGRTILCAGGIADRYLEMGGQVAWRGKPDPVVYRDCLAILGLDPTRVAVVGDSLETDMRGAHAAGLSGLWVTGGIHAQELDAGYGKPADPARMAELCTEHGLTPTAALAGFIW